MQLFYYFILANADRDEIEAFLDEIHMLKRVGIHRNIVTMLGIQNFHFQITKIMEYSHNACIQKFFKFFFSNFKNLSKYRHNVFKNFSKFFFNFKFFYRNIVTMLGI